MKTFYHDNRTDQRKGVVEVNACHQDRRGFTILFAVIIISVVTLLGATIAGIYQREARLRATSQASSEAFYAADSALECAMHYDRHENSFRATTTASDVANVTCSGTNSYNISVANNNPIYTRSFLLNSDDICAGVTVRKDTSGGDTITTISSRGRDTCNDSDRQAERALRTAY